MINTYCCFRSKLFHHMAQDHSFNLGNPDNIGRSIIFSVFLDQPSPFLQQVSVISVASACPSILPYIYLSELDISGSNKWCGIFMFCYGLFFSDNLSMDFFKVNMLRIHKICIQKFKVFIILIQHCHSVKLLVIYFVGFLSGGYF